MLFPGPFMTSPQDSMNKRSIWGITGHSHASNGMSLAAEVVAKKGSTSE
jgi:hypothetical protein